jgi:hypothetical protein
MGNSILLPRTRWRPPFKGMQSSVPWIWIAIKASDKELFNPHGIHRCLSCSTSCYDRNHLKIPASSQIMAASQIAVTVWLTHGFLFGTVIRFLMRVFEEWPILNAWAMGPRADSTRFLFGFMALADGFTAVQAEAFKELRMLRTLSSKILARIAWMGWSICIRITIIWFIRMVFQKKLKIFPHE